MGHQIDLRGLSCPQPVIHTDKALKESPEATLVVIVDNPAARDNVVRLAKSKQRTAVWRRRTVTITLPSRGLPHKAWS